MLVRCLSGQFKKNERYRHAWEQRSTAQNWIGFVIDFFKRFPKELLGVCTCLQLQLSACSIVVALMSFVNKEVEPVDDQVGFCNFKHCDFPSLKHVYFCDATPSCPSKRIALQIHRHPYPHFPRRLDEAV